MKKPAAPLKDLLFEIGTEELPATNLADLFESGENLIEARLKKVFDEKRISFDSARVWATPRRLVFWLQGVAPQQTPKENNIKLLARQEAYDTDGRPSEKFLTILKHRNAAPADTVTAELNGKEYVFLRKTEPAQKTVSLLPEMLEALVRSLPFPKTMKWDDSGVYFPRPIRGTLCLYGNKAVSLKIGHTRSKAQTVVFSKGRRTTVAVKDAASYFAALKKHGVILDPVERKKAIQALLAGLSAAFKARLYEDPFLLSEVNYLVENPHGVSAPFHEEFLKLPLEVLTVSMARKQRIFGLVDASGGVMPRFFAVLDGPAKEKQKKLISRNMENILHAKLQDSFFFYNEDAKIPLEKKREELKNLIFLKNAGSMHDKSGRLVRLAEKIAVELGLGDKDKRALSRAAFLCKADLLTQMVGEFPELQGVMGKYYALENGESEETALAIGEQYLPRTAQDKLPQTLAGGLLSLLDKCDLIVACFALGNEPTSSADPFGLRRSATAVLKILLEKKLPLSLDGLLSANRTELEAYAQKNDEVTLLKKLRAFFKDRFKALLSEKGYREDVIEAAMTSSFEVPCETFSRIGALSQMLSEERFIQACKVGERTMNILKGNKEPLPPTIDPALFAEELERRVFEHYEKAHHGIRQATTDGNFTLATSLYAEAFFDILGEFFDKVFVNAEDMNVRKNRLALLRNVNALYTAGIADLSKIHLK